jgi:hypothetical protein
MAVGLNHESSEQPGRPVLVVVAAIFERFCVDNERWHRLIELIK